jgi:hypothetical protein
LVGSSSSEACCVRGMRGSCTRGLSNSSAVAKNALARDRRISVVTLVVSSFWSSYISILVLWIERGCEGSRCRAGHRLDTALEKRTEHTLKCSESPSIDVWRGLGSSGVIRSTSGLRIGVETAREKSPTCLRDHRTHQERAEACKRLWVAGASVTAVRPSVSA